MPRIVDKELKRTQLLAAAVEAIAVHGLEDVKLVDIAREAGVTTGALGYYFGSKDELLTAALDHLSVAVFTGDRRSSMTHFVGDLGLYLPLTDESRRNWRVWLAYCGAAATSPGLREAYGRFYRSIEHGIADHLEERGLPDSADLAGTIVAAVDGIGLCATVAPDLWPEDRQIRAIRSLLAALIPTEGVLA